MSRRFRLALIVAALFAGASARADETIASRGAIQMTLDELRDALSRQEPAVKEQVLGSQQATREFVQDRLLRKVLLAELSAERFDQNPDIAGRANEAREAVLVQAWLATQARLDPAFPSQAEIQAAYEANKARFAVPTQYLVSQIAILVPAGATKEAEADALKKIRDIRVEALKPKADFAELARKSSQDKNSADKGGELGWVREDQIVGGVREAVRSLATDAISEPVRSNDAWHIVKVKGKKPPSVLPLDQVSTTLVNAMRANRAQEQVRAYIQALLAKQAVEINEVGLAGKIRASK